MTMIQWFIFFLLFRGNSFCGNLETVRESGKKGVGSRNTRL